MESWKLFSCKFPSFIVQQKLHINALELLTIIVMIKLWAKNWNGKRIKLFCDNETSVIVLNKGKTRDPFLQNCLREIQYLSAIYECEFKATHISGVTNRIPDLLSRWDINAKARDEFSVIIQNMSTRYHKVNEDMFLFMHKW